MNNKIHSTIICLSILLTLFLILPAVSTAAEVSDGEISIAVENQILRDPGCDLNDFDISTSYGIVTISGTVNNLLAKERAVKVAQTVKGVRSVIERITVKPPLRPDDEIKEDIHKAFLYDPISESWQISLAVENGHVTLTGTADSFAESEIVEKIAKGVKGVVSLDNNLDIIFKQERPAPEMEEEIKGRLHWDALVDDSLITVEVVGSKAFLRGTVGSAVERLQAERDSWVAGIVDVDSSGLEVNWWLRNSTLHEHKYIARDDAQIEKAINDALLYDPRVNMFTITVTADAGWVTLRGSVDNLLAKRSAAKDARNTVGVWHVKNFIKVRPTTIDDTTISENVRTALLMDPTVEKWKIDVSVTDGTVYLSGLVDSYYEKAKADHLASGVQGVRRVNNRLLVQRSEIIAHSPYIDPWYTYDFDWYVYPDYNPTKSDIQILLEIENELFWSPFVDADQIEVTVDDGLATLSGTVDSWFEYNAAAENALEGGAIGVDNELKVDNG